MFGKKKQQPSTPEKPAKLRDQPQLVVGRFQAGQRGGYLNISIPISYEAFSLLRKELSDEGKTLLAGGGSGNDREVSFQFGPFQSAEEAEETVKLLTKRVGVIFDHEQQLYKQFKRLEGSYPLG